VVFWYGIHGCVVSCAIVSDDVGKCDVCGGSVSDICSIHGGLLPLILVPISVVILHTNSPTPFLHFPHRSYCYQGHGTRGFSGRDGCPGREGER
jgi:hypothetical protein